MYLLKKYWRGANMNNLIDGTKEKLTNENLDNAKDNDNRKIGDGPDAETTTVICPVCGIQNIAGSKFCRECGERFLVEQIVPAESVNVSETSQNIPVQDVPVKDTNTVSEVSNTIVSEDLVEMKQEETAERLMLHCPFCGYENPHEAMFCAECGKKIVKADEGLDKLTLQTAPAVESAAVKSVELVSKEIKEAVSAEPQDAAAQFKQQPENEGNTDSKIPSVESLKNKVISATKTVRDTANQTIQNSKKIEAQDKSLVRLSHEKAGTGDMLVYVFGAMVVLLIVFRFVGSFFESPRTNYRQQQPFVGQKQTQYQSQKPSQTGSAQKQAQPKNNQNQTQPKVNQNKEQPGIQKNPVTQQPVAQPVPSGAVVGAYHSSADQEGNYVHSAKLAVDGNTGSCWSEGVKGLGIGENIEIHFNGNYKVSGMNIWVGHQKSQDLFYQNARPTALRVEGSDGSSEIYYLEDKFGSQRVTFKTPLTVNKVKLIVERVAPGNKYEDTCISEVKFF